MNRKPVSLAATLLLTTCVLPSEPSGAERIEFQLDFALPYRVPLAGTAQPAIQITAGGEALSNARYRLESLDEDVLRVDATERGLEGVARGTASVRVVYQTATGAPDTVFPVQVVVSRIAVSPSVSSLTQLGATTQLSATAYDAKDASVPDVAFTWSSATPEVAVVNETGLVRAVDEGTVAVTAEADSVKGLASIAVTQVAAQVRLAPELDTLRTVGRSAQFIAIAFDDTGGVLRTAKPRWSSSDPMVASVDGAGLATATGAGTARVIARVGEAADTGTLVVAQVIRFIVVTPGYDTLTAIADTGRLVALAFDSLNFSIPNPSVAWGTSDPAVATVDQMGLVQAAKNGVVLVTASAAGQSASATVLVRQEVVAARIAEDNVTLSGAGATVRLSGAGLDRNGFVVPDAALTWRSGSPCVATVDAAGLVTARGGGTTDIVAAPANGARSDTAALSVTGTPSAIIAFESGRGIEAICEDGSERRTLIPSPSGENPYLYYYGPPSWSPDGTSLAFVAADCCGGGSEIVVASADRSGTDAYPITQCGLCNYGQRFHYSPAWSPDGTRIAFVRSDQPLLFDPVTFQIVVSTTWGLDLFSLVMAGFAGDRPAWSPDGTKLAVHDKGSLYVINLDGPGSVRLIDNAIFPAWSPDGSLIAFQRDADVWVMNADGSGAKNLNAGATPAWSPDGSRLVFSATDGQHSGLLIINRDGTGLQPVTSTEGASSPAWRPATPPAGSQAATGALLGPKR